MYHVKVSFELCFRVLKSKTFIPNTIFNVMMYTFSFCILIAPSVVVVFWADPVYVSFNSLLLIDMDFFNKASLFLPSLIPVV